MSFVEESAARIRNLENILISTPEDNLQFRASILQHLALRHFDLAMEFEKYGDACFKNRESDYGSRLFHCAAHHLNKAIKYQNALDDSVKEKKLIKKWKLKIVRLHGKGKKSISRFVKDHR